MPPVEIIISVLALAILAPNLVLFTEVAAALRKRRRADQSMELRMDDRGSIAVIVPAHNEAIGIADTVLSLANQLKPGDRLLVVADNCSDDTAELASRAGAEVVVRSDDSRRGKGFALDFGVRHLRLNPPALVVIVDADCRLSHDSLERLAYICARTGRPVQAVCHSRAATTSGLRTRIAEFAFVLKNRVRPLGLHRLGLPCQLAGTGMMFPWDCINQAQLATGHIVEDLKLGLSLASAGHPPLFCPEAQVSTYFPESDEGTRTQRTRWEHGHLSVLTKDALPIILTALRTLNGPLLVLGIDLCVPPVALLALASAAAWLCSLLLCAIAGLKLPLLFSSVGVLLLCASVLLSWSRYGRAILSFRDLLLGVAYAFFKVPVYLRFVFARQLSWVRTKRDENVAE